jgi:hypothetical protein
MHDPACAAAPVDRTAPWRALRAHLERQALRPLPELGRPEAAIPDPEDRAAAAAILARFQLGEAGEGRIAREIHRCRLPGVDEDYRRAIELVVKEEGRHARILAAAVRALGGTLLAQQASTRLFVRARRLLGLRFKLLVLLIAEVGGGVVYGAVVRWLGARPGELREALAQIAGDERVHLDFHAAFFRVQGRHGFARWTLRAAFWAVGLAALVVVVAENGHDFRRLGLSPAALGRLFARGLREADSAAFAPPLAAIVTEALS